MSGQIDYQIADGVAQIGINRPDKKNALTPAMYAGLVEAFERALIAESFEAAGHNQSETARRLGVSRPALIEKLHKYGLIGR